MATCYGYKFTAKTADGLPLSFGLVYTYEAGATTTEKATYKDRDHTIINTNPVQLDAAGQADIYLDGDTSFVLKTAAGAAVDANANVAGGSRTAKDVTVTGNAAIRGTLSVGEDAAFRSRLIASGALSVAGDVTTGAAADISHSGGTLTGAAGLAATRLRTYTYIHFTTAIAASAATNQSLFLDIEDNIIKCKDATGATRLLY
jgi:hypothetical protein